MRYDDNNRRVWKRPRDARQGEKGPSMLLVLGLGLAGVVAAYLLIGMVNSDDDTVSVAVVEDGAEPGERVPAPAEQAPEQGREQVPDGNAGATNDPVQDGTINLTVPGAN